MRFENTKVFNFEGAFRGMRNPLESWEKSDSVIDNGRFLMGPTDLDLAQRLIRAGSADRKFMRQIFVCVDITAPNSWWPEFDTYKVGTVANSTSFMHKGMAREFTVDMFEHDDTETEAVLSIIVDIMNGMRKQYFALPKNERVGEKGESIWRRILQIRPSSWMYTRTVTMSYENVYSMIRQRQHHKQKEWRENFIRWAHTLPYAEELLFFNLKSAEQSDDK